MLDILLPTAFTLIPAAMMMYRSPETLEMLKGLWTSESVIGGSSDNKTSGTGTNTKIDDPEDEEFYSETEMQDPNFVENDEW